MKRMQSPTNTARAARTGTEASSVSLVDGFPVTVTKLFLLIQ